jgi:hypothetical protein
MYGIALIDIPAISVRYSHSALPKAPVIEDLKKRTIGVAARAERR